MMATMTTLDPRVARQQGPAASSYAQVVADADRRVMASAVNDPVAVPSPSPPQPPPSIPTDVATPSEPVTVTTVEADVIEPTANIRPVVPAAVSSPARAQSQPSANTSSQSNRARKIQLQREMLRLQYEIAQLELAELEANEDARGDGAGAEGGSLRAQLRHRTGLGFRV